MWLHASLTQAAFLSKIKLAKIAFAGNRKLKIYGLLNCTSGKRMKKQNRIFFVSETEALQHGYRPCATCMRKQYQQWISLTEA
ncbi:MAG TPA: metal-binding protein [Cytophagales bacterium]|nr:metal-binding protein [Cytophagales bacterium]HRG10178.1 Ada metal-binding domain-containing protein [Cyclobacteriaceae bacterium]